MEILPFANVASTSTPSMYAFAEAALRPVAFVFAVFSATFAYAVIRLLVVVTVSYFLRTIAVSLPGIATSEKIGASLSSTASEKSAVMLSIYIVWRPLIVPYVCQRAFVFVCGNMNSMKR